MFLQIYVFAHNSGPKGSPDMILTSFNVKFHEKKDELPPEAWNPQKIKNTTNKNKNATQNGSPRTPARPPVRGVRGAAASRKTVRFHFWRLYMKVYKRIWWYLDVFGRIWWTLLGHFSGISWTVCCKSVLSFVHTLGALSWMLILANNRVLWRTIGLPINRITHFYDLPKNASDYVVYLKLGPFGHGTIWGYGRKRHAKFCPWGMPWDPIYDYLGSMLCAKV